MPHTNEARPSGEWHEQKACFETYFPEGQIVRVALDDLPEDIVNQLEGRSRQLVRPQDYQEGNFDALYVVT
jgi:hypothetical protein